MASRLAMLKCGGRDMGYLLGFRRWTHVAALPPLVDAPSPPFVLPEFDRNPEKKNDIVGFGYGFPSFCFGGSMELMAVPKRKVSPHKRGIRNGPKALKPVPVII